MRALMHYPPVDRTHDLNEDEQFILDLFWEDLIIDLRKIVRKLRLFPKRSRQYTLIIQRRMEANYRCKKCGWFFSFYAQHPLERPKQCPRCRTRNPLEVEI